MILSEKDFQINGSNVNRTRVVPYVMRIRLRLMLYRRLYPPRSSGGGAAGIGNKLGEESELWFAFGWSTWYLSMVMYYPPLAYSLDRVASTGPILLLVILVSLHNGSAIGQAQNER